MEKRGREVEKVEQSRMDKGEMRKRLIGFCEERQSNACEATSSSVEMATSR
jgi:hypothetical protein